MKIQIDDTVIDTLTVKFWRDKPGWACHIRENFIEGAGGFGHTPLAALRDLCESIARDEGYTTDNGKLFLR